MPGPRRRRRLPPKPPPHKFDPLVLPDNCTEAYVVDWARYGTELLGGYLRKHADFEDFYDRNHHKEEL